MTTTTRRLKPPRAIAGRDDNGRLDDDRRPGDIIEELRSGSVRIPRARPWPQALGCRRYRQTRRPIMFGAHDATLGVPNLAQSSALKRLAARNIQT